MRKSYIDNIRWMTVILVVLYHVVYMFNGIETDRKSTRLNSSHWSVCKSAVSGCISIYSLSVVYAVVVCSVRNERKICTG